MQRKRRNRNCTGSYPFLYIARDFGLPYGAVLIYAELVEHGFVRTRGRPGVKDAYNEIMAGFAGDRARFDAFEQRMHGIVFGRAA